MASRAALYDCCDGCKFICPSLTASKAPCWYTTPAIVLGNLELSTLFSTTAPTATIPWYDSPLASPYIALANKFTFDDGLLIFEVIDKESDSQSLVCKALNSHFLKNRKGLNAPNIKLLNEYISSEDMKDLEYINFENIVNSINDYIDNDYTYVMNKYNGKWFISVW